jgi:hypothetical protein
MKNRLSTSLALGLAMVAGCGDKSKTSTPQSVDAPSAATRQEVIKTLDGATTEHHDTVSEHQEATVNSNQRIARGWRDVIDSSGKLSIDTLASWEIQEAMKKSDEQLTKEGISLSIPNPDPKGPEYIYRPSWEKASDDQRKEKEASDWLSFDTEIAEHHFNDILGKTDVSWVTYISQKYVIDVKITPDEVNQSMEALREKKAEIIGDAEKRYKRNKGVRFSNEKLMKSWQLNSEFIRDDVNDAMVAVIVRTLRPKGATIDF